MMDSSPLKQKLYDLGMKTGLAALADGKHSLLADKLLFRALRDRLGFSRLRSAATGGAAVGPVDVAQVMVDQGLAALGADAAVALLRVPGTRDLELAAVAGFDEHDALDWRDLAMAGGSAPG